MKKVNAYYDEDFGGIIVEKDGHRFGWQTIDEADGTKHLPRYSEIDGERYFYEQEAADCQPFDEDGIFGDDRDALYDAVERALTIDSDGDIINRES